MKLSTGVLYFKLSTENNDRITDSYTLRQGVKEFLPVLPVL